MVVAPGRMIDSFLSIPDAESLPLYRMVLKLACVCVSDKQIELLQNLYTDASLGISTGKKKSYLKSNGETGYTLSKIN